VARIKELRSLADESIFGHTKLKNQLTIRPVRRREHLFFNLLCFLFFRRSSSRGVETRPVGVAIALPYVLFSEVYFFRSQRYFVTIGRRVVGLFALEEEVDAVYVSALASNPFYRRMGIASLILRYTVAMARKRGKTAVELTVAKQNSPAAKLYAKFGFRLKKKKTRSYILQYQFQ